MIASFSHAGHPKPLDMDKLVDAHLHLQDPRLDGIRDALPAVFQKEGIRHGVINGTSEADWAKVRQCASPLLGWIPSYGLHPWWIEDRSADWLKHLADALTDSKAAVGEIGLDRWRRTDNLDDQESVFLAQWHLANELRRPVSVHCLKSWGRLMELIRQHPHHGPGFLLHAYGGPKEMIPEWTKLGAYFSVSAYLAHPRKASRIEVIRHIPRDRILIETDAPDMAPPAECMHYTLEPDRDGAVLNHPGNLVVAYQWTARWLETPLHALSSQVLDNFRNLFGCCLSR